MYCRFEAGWATPSYLGRDLDNALRIGFTYSRVNNLRIFLCFKHNVGLGDGSMAHG